MDFADIGRLADQVKGARADARELLPVILEESGRIRARLEDLGSTLEEVARQVSLAREEYSANVEPRWDETIQKIDEVEQILLQIGKKGGQLGLAQAVMETAAEWLKRIKAGV